MNSVCGKGLKTRKFQGQASSLQGQFSAQLVRGLGWGFVTQCSGPGMAAYISVLSRTEPASSFVAGLELLILDSANINVSKAGRAACRIRARNLLTAVDTLRFPSAWHVCFIFSLSVNTCLY